MSGKSGRVRAAAAGIVSVVVILTVAWLSGPALTGNRGVDHGPRAPGAGVQPALPGLHRQAAMRAVRAVTVTARTAPVKVKPHTARPAKPPKPPGKVALALRRRRGQAARAVLPYAAALTVAAIAGIVLHALWPPALAAGAAGWHGVLRLHEAHGWRRAGGKAAARRRRRYQGLASRREIRRHLSVRAVKRRAVKVPGLSPVPVIIGRAGGCTLAGTGEDAYAAFGPARSGKSGWLAGIAADAPGGCLITSTRTDMARLTGTIRAAAGPALFLNPGGDGGIPSTFTWNPLAGCETAAGAITRAGYLMDAAPKDPAGKDAWWDAQGAVLLRLMLRAGAVAGAPVTGVRGWVRAPLSRAPMAILESCDPEWAAELAGIAGHAGDDEYMRNVARAADTALAWLSDPAMARAACPRDSWEGLDAWQFIAGGGTVYLIGTDRPHNALTPYFAAFAAHLFDTGKQMAAASPHGRLDPHLTLVIDEPALTCPVPLPRWSSEAGGHGITLVTGFQARSQLTARWGPDDASTFWVNTSVKLWFGGCTEAADLEAVSSVCGDRDTWDHVKQPDGGRVRQPRPERVLPPERIRLLPEGKALLLHRRTRPVIASVPAIWDRRGYEPATAPAAVHPVPAIEPPAAPVPALAPGTGAPDPDPEPALAGSQ